MVINKGTLFTAVNSILNLHADYEKTKNMYHKMLNKIVNGKKYQWVQYLRQAEDAGYNTDFTFSQMQEHAQLDLDEDTIRDYQLFNLYIVRNYGKEFSVEWVDEEPKSIKNKRTVIFYGDYVYY